MTIQYYKKEVYGKPMFYIVDGQVAKTIQNISSKRTVTQGDMENFTKLGVQFEQVLQPSIPCSNMKEFDEIMYS